MSNTDLITGDVVGNTTEGFTSAVNFQSFETALKHVKKNYTRKATVASNALFYPYSCNPSEANMPHFLEPDPEADAPTVEELHPFVDDHDVGFVSSGDELPENMNPIEADTKPSKDTYRSIALKGPMVITGPCYDIDDIPYPSDDGENFIDNYIKRPDRWATGPLDVRFDPERGVYVAGSSGGTKLVQVITDGNFPAPTENLQQTPFKKVYKVQEYSLNYDKKNGPEGSNFTIEAVGEPFYAVNFRSNVILLGNFYSCHKVKGGFMLDNQADFGEFT